MMIQDPHTMLSLQADHAAELRAAADRDRLVRCLRRKSRGRRWDRLRHALGRARPRNSRGGRAGSRTPALP
jgi:hypothetical protein